MKCYLPLVLFAALGAPLAMAQTNNTCMVPGTEYRDVVVPDIRSPVMTRDDEIRAAKVIGSPVYNDHDQEVGTINDILIDEEGNVSAVVSVGGFPRDVREIRRRYRGHVVGASSSSAQSALRLACGRPRGVRFRVYWGNATPV